MDSDVNECERGECQGTDRICVNTLGGYKCHTVDCPNNYVRDPKFKKYTMHDDSCMILTRRFFNCPYVAISCLEP